MKKSLMLLLVLVSFPAFAYRGQPKKFILQTGINSSAFATIGSIDLDSVKPVGSECQLRPCTRYVTFTPVTLRIDSYYYDYEVHRGLALFTADNQFKSLVVVYGVHPESRSILNIGFDDNYYYSSFHAHQLRYRLIEIY